MTIIVNKCYGGFQIPEEFAKAHGYDIYDTIDRTDTDLVDFVMKRGGRVKFGYAHLVATNIPDNCTDWDIQEYDGVERVIYVVNGKIHYA